MVRIIELYNLELKNSEVFLMSIFISHIDRTAYEHVPRSIIDVAMKHEMEITYQKYRVGSEYPKGLRKNKKTPR
jgi:hypothetical protein